MPKTGISSNNMKLLIGVGTSLGVCFIARENENDNFDVFPSEACMVRMPIYNENDRELEQFLIKEKNI